MGKETRYLDLVRPTPLKVAELINENRVWNEIFIDEDAEAILTIPLSRTEMPDRLIKMDNLLTSRLEPYWGRTCQISLKEILFRKLFGL